MVIIDSNRREENHVIIQDPNYDKDGNNSMLANINEVENEVSISNPTTSNKTASVTTNGGGNYDVNGDEMIVSQMNQIDNCTQSKGKILTTDNDSLSINNNDAQIAPPLCNKNLYSNSTDNMKNENNSATVNDYDTVP